MSRSNTTLTEELETAKMEMNAANLKLVELMSVSQENNDDQEKLELCTLHSWSEDFFMDCKRWYSLVCRVLG